MLDDVECSGAESSLSECSHPGFRVHNCFRYQEAGVSCREGTHTPKENGVSYMYVPFCFMGTNLFTNLSTVQVCASPNNYRLPYSYGIVRIVFLMYRDS